jgi:sodium-coupled neutral amino acid transporter 3
MDRSFSKLEKGSLRGSMFALCSAAIGGGVLSLPYAMVLIGWANCYILFVVATVSGIWSNLMLCRIAIDTKVRNYDEVCNLAGGKCLQRTLSIMLFIYVTGTCIGYQIVISTLAAYICTSLGVDAHFTTTMLFRAYVNIPVAYLVFLPLSVMKDMSAFRYCGMFSLLALTYTGIVLSVEVPYYRREYADIATVYAFYFDWNFPLACAMVFFAFTCQLQILPIYSELVNPSYKRIRKVIYRSLIIDFLFYFWLTSCGYWATMNYTNTVVINRLPLPNFDPDYAMLFAAFGVGLVIMSAFPVNYNPFRTQLFKFFFKDPNYSQKA